MRIWQAIKNIFSNNNQVALTDDEMMVRINTAIDRALQHPLRNWGRNPEIARLDENIIELRNRMGRLNEQWAEQARRENQERANRPIESDESTAESEEEEERPGMELGPIMELRPMEPQYRMGRLNEQWD
jgi:hypothetical protein